MNHLDVCGSMYRHKKLYMQGHVNTNHLDVSGSFSQPDHTSPAISKASAAELSQHDSKCCMIVA